MIRSFWRLYIPVLVAFLLCNVALTFGPRVEARWFPIRANQRIEDVTRTADRLCWTWVSDKLRLAVSDNMDVWLDRPATGDRSYPEVFNSDTGLPWHRNGVLPVGKDQRRSYCVLLPPDATQGELLVLDQTIHYHGLWNLWDVMVPLPGIVSRPN